MPLGAEYEALNAITREGVSVSSTGVVTTLPPVPSGLYPGMEVMGVAVVGVGVSNPSASLPSGLTFTLESINPDGSVAASRTVSFPAVSTFNTQTIEPFYVAIGNALRVRITTAVGTGLTADVTVFTKWHGIPIPQQRQVIGVENV